MAVDADIWVLYVKEDNDFAEYGENRVTKGLRTIDSLSLGPFVSQFP